MSKSPPKAPQQSEVAVIDSDIVRQIKSFGELGWGAKSISKELGVSRNTVRRYLRIVKRQ